MQTFKPGTFVWCKVGGPQMVANGAGAHAYLVSCLYWSAADGQFHRGEFHEQTLTAEAPVKKEK